MKFFRCTTVLALMLISTVIAARAQTLPVLPVDPTEKTDPGVKVPEFEVATVKVNKGDSGMMRIQTKPDGFSCENIKLKNLISNAYGIKEDLISGGPAWLDTVGFDINAKVASSDVEVMKKLTGRQHQDMLRPLMEERFKLKVHVETKTLPIYDLVVAKGGTKLKEMQGYDPVAEAAKDPKDRRHVGWSTTRAGGYMGEGETTEDIAAQMSWEVHRTVVDKTGLKGKYDFNLTWTPEQMRAGGDDGSNEAGASVFTALQEQLGLRLVPSKGPVDTLVIDSVEKPTED